MPLCWVLKVKVIGILPRLVQKDTDKDPYGLSPVDTFIQILAGMDFHRQPLDKIKKLTWGFGRLTCGKNCDQFLCTCTYAMGSLISRCICCSSCKRCADSPRSKKYSSNDMQTVIVSGDNSCGEETKKYSWDSRPRVNPQDYTIGNIDSDQKVKRPGEINGQQFIIRNCTNSKIYLFDYSSTITIDDCSDCLFVLGPVQSSVFLRDSKNSTLVCCSSQLRLRDCQNIHLFVGCESDPIIEASAQVIVGPYFLSYKGIDGHFKSANLSKFKATNWSEIYDFTPNDLTPNWNRFSRQRHDPQKYICPPQPDHLFSDLNFSVTNNLSFIPVTHHFDSDLNVGKPWRKQEVTFTLEPGQDLGMLEEFMNKFYESNFVLHNSSLESASSILTKIESIRTQFIFTYYTLNHVMPKSTN